MTIWSVELISSGRRAMLLTPSGTRVAEMTCRRAVGIAAALNDPHGASAFAAALRAFDRAHNSTHEACASDHDGSVPASDNGSRTIPE